jgi:phasin family protein
MSEVENTAALPEAPQVTAPVAKIDVATAQAYAEAPKVAAAPFAKTIAAPKIKGAKAAPAQKVAKTVRKTATKPSPAKKAVPAKKAEKPIAPKAFEPKTNPVIKLKDTIMATANNTDIAATAKEVFADVQARAQTTYAKGTVLAAEATEFTKASVEAVVESGKIFVAGAQELLKDNIETGKTVIETVTEDAKKVAAVKSPTELMQLQGEIARRNFDALVSFGSKRTEAWVKLYNEAFAPISNRVSVAAEKIKKAA